jgi:hypothetical protein
MCSTLHKLWMCSHIWTALQIHCVCSMYTMPWRCSQYLNNCSHSFWVFSLHHAIWRCSTYLNSCSNSLCMFNVHHAMEVFKIFEHLFTFIQMGVQSSPCHGCVQDIWKAVHIQYFCSTLHKLWRCSKYLNICSQSFCVFSIIYAVKVFKIYEQLFNLPYCCEGVQYIWTAVQIGRGVQREGVKVNFQYYRWPAVLTGEWVLEQLFSGIGRGLEHVFKPVEATTVEQFVASCIGRNLVLATLCLPRAEECHWKVTWPPSVTKKLRKIELLLFTPVAP